MNLINHYKKLWFFNFNRRKGDNYKLLREYYADILIEDVEKYMELAHKTVLDIGGARGEFCKVLYQRRHCNCTNLEPEPYKHGYYDSDFIWRNTIRGYSHDIPCEDNKFDLVICRGVLEHVERQYSSVVEIDRVLKPGGIAYVMIPPWYSPFGGHQLKPFHLLPFSVAKFLKKRVTANSLEELQLYPLTCAKFLSMVSLTKLKVVATKDIHFRLHWLAKIPILREFLVPSVLFILTKEGVK